MRTVEQVAQVVAETLMPDDSGLVFDTAEAVASDLLEGHAVVELPFAALQDLSGVIWQAPDGLELVRVSGDMLWIDDDILTPDQAVELASALLAAARLASTGAAVPQ
ncbi:hypothetical protein [Rhodococcus sp. SJ-2]